MDAGAVPGSRPISPGAPALLTDEGVEIRGADRQAAPAGHVGDGRDLAAMHQEQ